MTFRINRVYTRSGDTGTTALVDGSRVSKSSARVHAFGSVDELNATIGLVVEHIDSTTELLSPVCTALQQELFDLGAELATMPNAIPEGMWRVDDAAVKRLEGHCDAFGHDLPELESFILPGGSKLAAALHLARTVSRRAERAVVALFEEEACDGLQAEQNPYVLQYLNRLSDLLFVLCRWSLHIHERPERLWIPAGKR